MRKCIRYATVAVILAVLASAAPADAASKPPRRRVACNETIMKSLRLANDLDCDEDGLVIGAPGITVDLDGHRIVGDGGTDDFGVFNPGFEGVTIRNGSISNFDAGVYVIAASRNKIQKILATEHNDGILLESVERSVVQGSTVVRNTFTGIFLFNTDRTKVKGNTVTGNGGDGLLLVGSSKNKLLRNTSSGNGDEGIEVSAASSDNILEKNRITGNGDDGLLVEASMRNRFETNTMKGNEAAGVRVEGSADDNRFLSNRVTANDQNGIVVSSSDGNVFKENNASGNGGAGILLDSTEGSSVKANVTSKNVANGIWVLGGTDNSVIGNTAHRNGEDGILSSTNQVTISKNRANENGFLGDPDGDDDGLGIFAPAGTAGKKNKAKDNDDPDECDPAELCV